MEEEKDEITYNDLSEILDKTNHAFKDVVYVIDSLKRYSYDAAKLDAEKGSRLFDLLYRALDSLKKCFDNDRSLLGKEPLPELGKIQKERQRADYFTFDSVGLGKGARIDFKNPHGDTKSYYIVSDKTIAEQPNGVGKSLTAVASEQLNRPNDSGVKATRYFYYEGTSLEKLKTKYDTDKPY